MRRALGVLGGVCLGIVLFGTAAMYDENEVEFSREAPSATTTMQASSAVIERTVQTITNVVTPRDSAWKRGVATVFWVGEDESTDNGFIHNRWSAWDVNWEGHFGGIDDPVMRCGFEPCAFVPKENPFYVALPYNDLDAIGRKKENTTRIPWNDAQAKKSVLKNRWIAVRAGGTVCYGQWQDVGPFEQDDIEYVFGDAETARNTLGMRAGIDLSPALRDCLKIGDVATVEWRHVEEGEVPQGPWTKIVTTRR